MIYSPQSRRAVLVLLFFPLTAASFGAPGVGEVRSSPEPPLAQSQAIREGERLRISIVGLLGDGVETRVTRRVEPGGTVRLPGVDSSRLNVTGEAAAELEGAIKQLYEKHTTARISMVVVSRLDAEEDHALEAWREPLPADRVGGLVVRGTVAPWPTVLSEPLGTSWEVKELPLGDLITRVHERTNLPMWVDWAMLEMVGVDRDTTLSFYLPRDVAVGCALDVILESASPVERLSYDWVDGVLTISTADADVKRKQTVVINVSPLLSSGAGVRDERDEQIEAIVEAIQASISPDIWLDNGGDLGGIRTLEDKLVITAPPRVLREVLALLSKLAG